jgi:malonate decarboxylase alpha subunit
MARMVKAMRGHSMRLWNSARRERDSRLQAGARHARSKRVGAAHDTTALLEAVIPSGDRVCIEGGDQKQADLLAAAPAAVEKSKIRYLRMVQTGVVLPEHLDVLERGIARRLDYSYSGPQADGIAKLLAGGKIELGGHYPLTGDVS